MQMSPITRHLMSHNNFNSRYVKKSIESLAKSEMYD